MLKQTIKTQFPDLSAAFDNHEKSKNDVFIANEKKQTFNMVCFYVAAIFLTLGMYFFFQSSFDNYLKEIDPFVNANSFKYALDTYAYDGEARASHFTWISKDELLNLELLEPIKAIDDAAASKLFYFFVIFVGFIFVSGLYLVKLKESSYVPNSINGKTAIMGGTLMISVAFTAFIGFLLVTSVDSDRLTNFYDIILKIPVDILLTFLILALACFLIRDFITYKKPLLDISDADFNEIKERFYKTESILEDEVNNLLKTKKNLNELNDCFLNEDKETTREFILSIFERLKESDKKESEIKKQFKENKVIIETYTEKN